jgi:hypothetical protein
MDVKLLSKYPLEQVKLEIENHIADPEDGKFYPKACQIIGRIGNDEVINYPEYHSSNAKPECGCSAQAVIDAGATGCIHGTVWGMAALQSLTGKPVKKAADPSHAAKVREQAENVKKEAK